MATWENVRQELHLTVEDENLIKMEKDLIRTMVEIRESKGLT